ncbi:hypothetical protein [Flavobacterium sp.]|uniref:DUF7940 domain-containing protein n=1 Tax=Flavobacterium sp. TaxID=239 RepID=UPI0037BE68FD
MKLYDNWRYIAKKAWSIKFAIAAGVLSGLELALAIGGPIWFEPGLLAGLSAACCCAAVIARLVAQKDI